MPLLVIAWLDQAIQTFRSPSIKSFLDSGVRRNDDKIRYFATVPINTFLFRFEPGDKQQVKQGII